MGRISLGRYSASTSYEPLDDTVKKMTRMVKRSCLLTMLVLLAACAKPATDAPRPSREAGPAQGSTSTATAEGAETIPEILDFQFVSLGGETVDGADYAGKDVAVWFWAPW